MTVFEYIRRAVHGRREHSREELRKLFRERAKWGTRQRELRLEQRRLMWQLRLRGRSRSADEAEAKRLEARLAEIRAELDELHMRSHLRPFGVGVDADFDRYYRHIRITRLFVLFFNLALWALLFLVGGLGTGLTLAVLFFAVLSAVGSVFEILFQAKISERILVPVDALRRGVQQVAQGNYDVRVENEKTSEIASLIEAFNEMAQKLREGEKLKREYEENRKALVANISHDLKTPLTSIRGYVEALGDGGLPPEKTGRYLKIIRSNADYMNRLVDDLFVFSRLDMQRLEFHFEPTRIRPFLRDMMEEFGLDLAEQGVEFHYADELAEDYMAKLDGRRVNQILRNLIGNAVRHGGKKGLCIRARLFEAGGRLCIAVADNGPGIPQESLPHLFERFYRVDPERTKNFESTGLGLAIAKELAEAHGGTIAVRSEAGAGTCFTVSLPWTAKADADTEGEQGR